jgi:hypothetical protein
MRKKEGMKMPDMDVKTGMATSAGHLLGATPLLQVWWQV